MSLKMGIVGLPNVGKSTLFNIITNSKAEAINYPFATIEPNVGIVEVPDPRIDQLFQIFSSKKAIRPTFEFIDIAGLIKGASKGEGLGNKFLAKIRDCDAICMVVRCFDDSDIIHVEGTVDPIRDVEIIQMELLISDEEQITKRLGKVGKKAKADPKSFEASEQKLLQKLKEKISEGLKISEVNLTEEEIKILKTLNLLSIKPNIFVANISENCSEETNPKYKKILDYGLKQNITVIPICIKVEETISELSNEEKLIILEDIGVKETGLDKLIKSSYSLLGLKTFFTAGQQEVRGWTFYDGYTAPECAGVIHTDFKKGFIKADVYNYDDILVFKNEKELKENGKIRSEGKSYLVKDGDVCFFKFSK